VGGREKVKKLRKLKKMTRKRAAENNGSRSRATAKRRETRERAAKKATEVAKIVEKITVMTRERENKVDISKKAKKRDAEKAVMEELNLE
jgi:hypothetical protein